MVGCVCSAIVFEVGCVYVCVVDLLVCVLVCVFDVGCVFVCVRLFIRVCGGVYVCCLCVFV